MSRKINKVNPYRTALVPYSIWRWCVILVPLVFIGYYAFTDNSFNFTMEHFTRFFTATSSVTADDGTTQEAAPIF